jgi:hypothetical protein
VIFEYIASHEPELKKLKSNFFNSVKKDNTLTQLVSTTIIKSGTSKEHVTWKVTCVKEIGDDNDFRKPIKHKTINENSGQGYLFDENELIR